MRARRHLTRVALAVAASCALSACAPGPTTVPARNDEAPSPAPTPTTSTPAPEPTPVASDDATSEPPSEEPSSETPTPTPSPTPTVAPSPSVSTPPAVLAPGDEGEEVRDLQHRLLQLRWFEGPITPTYGARTQAAVEGFQAKRGLPVTGSVDDATLAKLRAMTHTPSHDEKHNVLKPGPAIHSAGDKGDAIRDLQSRMRQIGWYGEKVDGVYGPRTVEGVRGFQTKRGIPVTGEVDQRTLDKLHAMTRKPTADELRNKLPSKDTSKAKGMQLDERCMTGRAVCISKRDRTLAWVVDGKVRMTMDVRFGAKKEPTREGTFQVEWKSRNHVSKLYDSKMPYALFFSGGQAIHYSTDFAARGYRGASHGCVNVRDKAKVAALFEATTVGDKVIVYA